MATHAVNVSGIAPSTTKEQLSDFFTFCGKINAIDYAEKSGNATIHFEKPSAAKTALMLSGGTLDGATLNVSSDQVHPDEESTAAKDLLVEQSDKPRAGIAAEYLAKGYALSDSILQRAIELDHKQGISSRFLNYFHSLDASIGAKALGPEQTISGKVQSTVTAATQHAKEMDEQKGISKAAHDYYTKAISSPFGQKVKEFYTSTSKQVHDIHEEARRIADAHKRAAQPEQHELPVEPSATSTATGSAAQPDPKTQAAPTVV